MLLFRNESEMAFKLFLDFAHKKQVKIVTILLTDNNTGEERAIKKQILKGMAEVENLWIIETDFCIKSYTCLFSHLFQGSGLAIFRMKKSNFTGTMTQFYKA